AAGRARSWRWCSRWRSPTSFCWASRSGRCGRRGGCGEGPDCGLRRLDAALDLSSKKRVQSGVKPPQSKDHRRGMLTRTECIALRPLPRLLYHLEGTRPEGGFSMSSLTRTTDEMARVHLPESFANATVILDQISDTELRIRKAQDI